MSDTRPFYGNISFIVDANDRLVMTLDKAFIEQLVAEALTGKIEDVDVDITDVFGIRVKENGNVDITQGGV